MVATSGLPWVGSTGLQLISFQIFVFLMFFLTLQDFEASGLPVPNARHHSPGAPMGGSAPGASGGKSRSMDASYNNFPGRGSTSYNKLKKAVSNRLFSQVCTSPSQTSIHFLEESVRFHFQCL